MIDPGISPEARAFLASCVHDETPTDFSCIAQIREDVRATFAAGAERAIDRHSLVREQLHAIGNFARYERKMPVMRGMAGFGWLLLGGLAYTFGVIFYVYDERVRHFHGIWHLFVLAGSTIQYFIVFYYICRLS